LFIIFILSIKHFEKSTPNFIIKNQRIFEEEKKKLISLVNEFYKAGHEDISKFPHPFFATSPRLMG